MLRQVLFAALLASSTQAVADNVSSATDEVDNVLMQPWTGPYGGLPPFDQVTVEALQTAITASSAEYLAEIDAIANNKKKPTFENTIAALEDSGRTLTRVMSVYHVFSSTMSTPELRAVEGDVAAHMSTLRDQVIQNSALFARINAVYHSPKKAKLTAEQQRVTWVLWNQYAKAGATLDEASKARMTEINQELAGLYTDFGQHLLADEETWIVIESEDQLAGLPADMVATMAAGAAGKGLEGKWIVSNTRSSMQPVLQLAHDRDLRKRVWTAYVNRGDNADGNDNNAIITQILLLRSERATLLGYESHAHWMMSDTMARTPDNAMALMEQVWPAAIARVAVEVAAQQAIADAEHKALMAEIGEQDESLPPVTIEPWDYRYYQEKVRKAQYDLDQNEIKPYLQLEKLREGMFWMAGELYGLQFKQIHGVPVHHPDVRVWEVTNADGHVGLWYFDPYARAGKRSGAWMNNYRDQERFRGDVAPIVSNNSNFTKGADGEAVLISWDDAGTLFHEFGHAIHGLLSDVTYPTVSGTNTARDFVEFPSQLHEHWLATPELLSKFALHVETGEPMPAELLDRIEASANFDQGFATTEYLASAFIDMKLHLAGSEPIDADAFERDTLAGLNMPSQIVMRHRTPQFAHVFSGDGYSAGYYSYLWSDSLTADAAEAFNEAGGMYDPGVAAKLVEHILSAGGTVDEAEAFRAFRGRDVSTDALLRKRGFAE